jgi:hypothetical protein
LEEIPDLGHELERDPETGEIVEVDPYVQTLLLKHYERDYRGHGGGTGEETAPFRIPVVDDLAWAHDREGVIKAVNAENKKVGFDAWAYEATNTFSEDALRCYNEHHRPKEGCIDWWSESKRIGRPTEIGRAVVKDQYKLGERDPHLCQFCPVATYVQTQINWRQGRYKSA